MHVESQPQNIDAHDRISPSIFSVRNGKDGGPVSEEGLKQEL